MIVDVQRAAKEGNEQAIIMIVEQHRDQIRAMAWKLNCGRQFFDDLQTEGLIGILQAIDYNNPRRSSSMRTLVGRFARFRMFNMLRKEKVYRRRQPLIEDMGNQGDGGDWIPFEPQATGPGPDKLVMLLEECPKRLRLEQMRNYSKRHRLRLRKYAAGYWARNRETILRKARERYRRKVL